MLNLDHPIDYKVQLYKNILICCRSIDIAVIIDTFQQGSAVLVHCITDLKNRLILITSSS